MEWCSKQRAYWQSSIFGIACTLYYVTFHRFAHLVRSKTLQWLDCPKRHGMQFLLAPRHNTSIPILLPIRCIRPRHRRQLRLPLVPIRQQLLLVIQQLLPRLGRVLRIRALDNRIHGAALLAESAVDALGHVDVVARGAAGAVLALLGLDRDGAGGADGFAQLAGDAAFFAGRVPAQGVFAAEARGDGSLFEGVEDCVAIKD